MADSVEVSRGHLRRIYAGFVGNEIDAREMSASVASGDERLADLVARSSPWGSGYEMSFEKAALALLELMGMLDLFQDAARSDDPIERVTSLIDDPPEPDDVDFETLCSIVFLLSVVSGNADGFKIYGRAVSQLVEMARDGDDEALFQAVSVDRAVLSAEPVARRICIAEAKGEETFMHHLAKAITRTRPRRPEARLDHARFMLEVLEATIGLDNLTYESIYGLLVEDLEVYPDHGKDPMSGLKKLIQKRKAVREAKP